MSLENREEYLALLERLNQLQDQQLEVQPRQKYSGRPPNARPQRSGGDSPAVLVVERRTAATKRKRDEQREASQVNRLNRFPHMGRDEVQICRKCLRSDDRCSEPGVQWIQCEGPCDLWFHNICYNETICEYCP